MAYEAVCPKGHRLQVTDAHIGKQVRCPTCGEPFTVPVLDTAEAIPGGQQPSASAPSEPPTLSPRRRRPSSGASAFTQFSQVAGHPLILVGIVMVLGARGCDSLGIRSVTRASAKVRMAKQKFSDSWESKRLAINRETRAIGRADNPKARYREPAAELQKQLFSRLRKDEQKERERLEAGEWRDLEIAAHNAASGNLIDGYWREVAFLLGTIGLSIGLLAVGSTGQGTERWICLIMLAIITFSVYVGGIAWISSLINAVAGSTGRMFR